MAGRPPVPTNILKLQGTFRQARHAKRLKEPRDPVGSAPSYLPSDARRAWKEVADTAPWLTIADRPTLEVLSRLLAEARADFAGMSAARIAILVSTAGRLGFSPVERARLSTSTDPETAKQRALAQKYFGD